MNNEIRINRAILQIIDNSGGLSIVSDKAMVLTSEIDEYISKHLQKCFSDIDVKNTKFKDDHNNEFLSIVKSFKQDDSFLITSKKIAGLYMDIINQGTTVPSGDLIIVDFMCDNEMYLGLLKLNYKNSFIHFVESNDGIRNTIVNQICALPLETQKLDEFALIKLSDDSIKVKEKKYEVNGVKEYYLTKFILNTDSAFSDKTVVDIVEKAGKRVIQTEYDNDVSKLNTFKKVVSDGYAMTNEINLEKIADATFDDENGRNIFKQEIAKAGIYEGKIKISPNAEKRIMKKHKLVTDSGIEISIPTSFLADDSIVEFVNNINGTISIVIKDIEILSNK
ncbi:MAG: nucleoid-associated protein [Eubacteriaceae bacterium]|nr:nucleoid-associated protein [Eubacteriaceae bacterium]